MMQDRTGYTKRIYGDGITVDVQIVFEGDPENNRRDRIEEAAKRFINAVSEALEN